MDVQEAYQPGMLSALLLDGRDDASIERPAHPGDDAASPESTTRMGGCKTLDDVETKAVSLKKKKKKKMNRDGDERAPLSSTSIAVDSKPGATSTLGEGQEEDTTGTNAAASASSLDALSSLFSSGNLKKFKRRARQDQEIDELEVQKGDGRYLVDCITCFWACNKQWSPWQGAMRTVVVVVYGITLDRRQSRVLIPIVAQL